MVGAPTDGDRPPRANAGHISRRRHFARRPVRRRLPDTSTSSSPSIRTQRFRRSWRRGRKRHQRATRNDCQRQQRHTTPQQSEPHGQPPNISCDGSRKGFRTTSRDWEAASSLREQVYNLPRKVSRRNGRMIENSRSQTNSLIKNNVPGRATITGPLTGRGVRPQARPGTTDPTQNGREIASIRWFRTSYFRPRAFRLGNKHCSATVSNCLATGLGCAQRTHAATCGSTGAPHPIGAIGRADCNYETLEPQRQLITRSHSNVELGLRSS